MMSMQEAEDLLDEPTGAERDDAGNVPAGSAPDDLRILEAVLFASDELMTAGHLKMILPGQPDARNIRRMVEKINIQLQKERHPFEIVEIGGGYQFRTITYYHPWVRQIFKEKASKKLSIQALESLAIIAYKQPISKAEIEGIRGVVSDGAMKTLLEKRLITIAGRSDKPGRPLLYGTTQTFLKYFGLNKIEDLPRIEEFEAMAREKMEDLSIEELAMPETAPEEETTGLGVKDRQESPAPPVETPVKSSLFEVEVTPPAAEKETLEAAGGAQSSGEDEPVDFEIDAKAEKPVVADKTLADNAKPPESDEQTFEVNEKVSVNEVMAIAESVVAGAGAETDKSGAEKETVVIDPVALRGETAFDLDAIIPQDDPIGELPVAHPEKKTPAIIDSAALRGETAFDLEAIIIEEPILRMPVASEKGEKASVTVDDDSDNNPFEVKEAGAEKGAVSTGKAAAHDNAGPLSDAVKEDTAAFEVKEPEPAKEAVFNLEDAIEEVTPENPAAANDDGDAAFEPVKPVSEKAAEVDFEDTMDDLIAESLPEVNDGEEETLFELKPAGVSSKPPETAYFEVGESSVPVTDSAAACEKLAEELKETAVLRPEKSRNPAPVNEGSTRGKIDGGKTARKRSAGSADAAAEKPADAKTPVKRTRTRRTGGSGAPGAS